MPENNMDNEHFNDFVEVDYNAEENFEEDNGSITRIAESIERELADAIVRHASMDELQLMMEMEVNVHQKLRHGLSLLHYAVWQNYIEAEQLLLDAGADINARDDIGYSPLHLAAEHGFIESIRFLLRHNARVNHNIPSSVQEEFPIDVYDEPLRLAIKHNHYESAKLLLENGAKPDTKYFFGSEINLVNPLNCDILNLLLSYGVDPNTRDRYGFTPLMKSCRLQRGMESSLILLSYGADPNMRADFRHDNRSVLHYAVLSGSTSIVNLVIKQGANVVFESGYNNATPLHLAILKGEVQIVRLLIDAGSDTNAVSSILGSPLHMACSEGVPNRREILELLLKKGANPNIIITGSDGIPIRSPLAEYLNVDKPENAIVKLLLKHGAEVIMQSQNRHPQGILNYLPNLSKYENVLYTVMKAAHKFDISLIRNSSLIDKDQREEYLKVAKTPLPLTHTIRLSLRKQLGEKVLHHVEDLELPKYLESYLLYEIS